MGYESKLFFVTRNDGSEISSLNMYKMPEDFRKVFTKPYDMGLNDFYTGMTIDDQVVPDVTIKMDRYGFPLRYAEVEEVYKYVERSKDMMGYIYMDILYAILKELMELEWYKKVIVVHFGY